MGHCIGMGAYLGQYGGTVNRVEFPYVVNVDFVYVYHSTSFHSLVLSNWH